MSNPWSLPTTLPSLASIYTLAWNCSSCPLSWTSAGPANLWTIPTIPRRSGSQLHCGNVITNFCKPHRCHRFIKSFLWLTVLQILDSSHDLIYHDCVHFFPNFFSLNSFWSMEIKSDMFFFKKWALHGLFFVYFRSFQTNKQYTFCHKSMWKNVNPVFLLGFEPLIHESSPITTRPGVPPKFDMVGLGWQMPLEHCLERMAIE